MPGVVVAAVRPNPPIGSLITTQTTVWSVEPATAAGKNRSCRPSPVKSPSANIGNDELN